MALKYVYSQVGDVLSSTTISNLGVAKLPEEMSVYVRRMDFILGPLADNRVCCAALTYHGRLRINFTRTIAEPLPYNVYHEYSQGREVQRSQPASSSSQASSDQSAGGDVVVGYKPGSRGDVFPRSPGYTTETLTGPVTGL